MNDQSTEKQSWWQRLSGGLKRTSASIGGAVTDLVAKRRLDQAMLDEIEDVLIRADLGVESAARIAAAVGEGRYDKSITADEVKAVVATEVEKVLTPVAKPLLIDGRKPFVALVVGVNGSGKTTTIGKLAAKFRAEGRSVMLAAGDTFRAAAIDQLNIWGGRSGASVIARPPGADAAGLAFDALTQARGEDVDVLLVDTAGRLQNKAILMDELQKIVRVMKKVDAAVPHAVLLVLDATVGQNALSQVEVFRDIAGVTGLVMTKLDGTARGGILVAIAAKYGLPVHFIGVGEGIDDLAPFSAKDLARATVKVPRRDGNCRSATLHSAHDREKTSAQPPPQARTRSRAVAAVLPRQFAPGAVPAAGLAHIARGHRVGRAHRYLRRDRSVYGRCGGRARGVVRADAALAGHAARHRGHRAGVWVTHAGPARRALHQAQAHHHLPVVRGCAA